MNILGIFIFVLPYLAGYIQKPLLGKKETGQSEIYLCGLFLIFLLQGIILAPGILFGISFDLLCTIWQWTMVAIAFAGLESIIFSHIRSAQKRKHTKVEENSEGSEGRRNGAVKEYLSGLSYEERYLLLLCIVTGGLVVTRIILLREYVRLDGVEGGIRLMVTNHSLFTHNPYNNQPLSLGFINSRKIVTLPVFYSFLVCLFNLDINNFVNIYLIIAICLCSYLAVMLVAGRLLKGKNKKLIFTAFYFALLLSGDYFAGAIGYKLLHNGYSGDTIVAAVVLPFVMYTIIRAYSEEKSGTNAANRIAVIWRLILALGASFFITTIVKGVLPVIIEAVILGGLCTVKLIREAKE